MILSELATVENDRSKQVSCIAASLNHLIDVDLLLGKILSKARQVVRAEAGTVYLVTNGKLKFQTSQNDYLERLIHDSDDLPFIGSNLEIDSSTLAGYVAQSKAILTVNNTENIDFDAPFQHLIAIDASTNYICKAIMSIPLVTHNGILLGILQLINPMDGDGQVVDFTDQDVSILEFFSQSVSVALERAITLKESIINSLKLVELHDQTETTAHVERISLLTTAIYKNWAQKNNLPEQEKDRVLNLLPLASMLHDVGKAWIPTHILNKPGRLNQQERVVMEDHVPLGAKLYVDVRTPMDQLVYDIICDHHERWDGLGYPGIKTQVSHQNPAQVPELKNYQSHGLNPFLKPGLNQNPGPTEPRRAEEPGGPGERRGKKGEEISIYGRILAVADVYDALSSRKSYKEPFDESLVIQIMTQESGRHFDPSVIESFLAVRPILAKIRERHAEVE
ncbi:MAG: HD domain-containing protein [Deltaproteobacteria bacterium]|nr:HD domain-containing protein [Deltaproteobacteria bacterium]